MLGVTIPLLLRSPPPPSLTSLESVDDRVHRAGAVERIPFRASAGTNATIILEVFNDPSERWDLRLLDDEGLVLSTGRLIEGRVTRIDALLTDGGTYVLELSGGSDSPYRIRGQEAEPTRVVPLPGGTFDGSLEGTNGIQHHPITVAGPGPSVVTVESELPHYVTVLDLNESYTPDYEQPLLSRTVLAPGEYLLEVSMDKAGHYSVRVEEPTVEPLIEGQTKEATMPSPGSSTSTPSNRRRDGWRCSG